jgi:hypothetical protein
MTDSLADLKARIASRLASYAAPDDFIRAARGTDADS